ncbi:MAG: OmpA family protein [Smithella sp.]
MKRIGLLAVMAMLTAIFTATQADARPGGLPDLVVDKNVKDCGCPPCCSSTTVTNVKKQVAKSHKKVSITLKVEFDTAKSVVKDKYNNEIKRVADFMKEYPDTNAVIEGHTDNVGKAEYNQKLSQDRANSVRQYLIDKFGIDGSRITAVGYGITKPIASNDTKEGKQKNRRVVAIIK